MLEAMVDRISRGRGNAVGRFDVEIVHDED